MSVRIERVSDKFSDWGGLLQLLHAAFASQEDRIDPPSSLHRLDPELIAEKAAQEQLFLAIDRDTLLGCVFVKMMPAAMYVGKLAVSPEHQGQGIGRRLMQMVEDFACLNGRSRLELETRIELTENHETFAALGYVKVAEHAHEGYGRTTFITMRKILK